MDYALLLQAVSTAALVGALVFAGIEWRATRRQSLRASELLLLRSFESPEFTRSMKTVLDLPPGLDKSEIDSRLGESADLVWYWASAMESIGILVFKRQVDLRLVDGTFGAPILTSWQKLHGYVVSVRAELGTDAMHEWFQWLVERLTELEHERGRSPAHVRERGWKP